MFMRNSLSLKSSGVAVVAVMILVALTSKSTEPRALTLAASPSLTARAAPVIPQGQVAPTEVKGLVIAIRPTGFVPPTLEVADGRYLFVVQNRSGIRDLTFRLDSEAGERLHEVHDQKLQWKKEFDLHPGTYVLSVVDHPTWRCLIKVKPR
jgi:hypothetical protein